MSDGVDTETGNGAQPVFTMTERVLLLGTKGVGPKVVERLEAVGYGSFARLRQADATCVVSEIAALLGTTCWRNSPQARASVQAAIDLAHTHPAR